ncbi:hypothetical protein BKA66DRAFT_509308 [Pyrenochaeta sp. MPI-SDFR-AT-0127]|nr:hypothetical protein BKA66DRAFT_509308 [Pyrenochaeta sp. MPI-SDFR-AT-0127]
MADSMGDDTQAPMLLGISGGLLLISILLLHARLWSRARPISNLGLDDWTVFAATILVMAKYFLVCVACAYGFGRRAKFVPLENRSKSLRLIFICQVLWFWSITLVKLSVALLLVRLKPTRCWRIFLFSIMGVLILNAIMATCFQFLQCRPFSLYWDPSVFRKGGIECVPRSAITGNIIAGSAVHVSTDLIFSFMPITFIRKLTRPRREKIFLGILMGLGLFAALFAILRTVGLQNYYTSKDVYRTSVMPTLWSMLEQEVALIAATIPTLKSFMERALVKMGQFFYDENTETHVRQKLVELGFLELNEKDSQPQFGTKEDRKPSKRGI